jgi:hypothetical protein
VEKCHQYQQISVWQHITHVLNRGGIVSVNAMMDIVDTGKVCHGRLTQLHMATDKGFNGSIITDVLTEPAEKTFRLRGETRHY